MGMDTGHLQHLLSNPIAHATEASYQSVCTEYVHALLRV